MDKALEGVESRDFTRGSLVFDSEEESPDEPLEPNSALTISQNLQKTDEHFAEVFITLHGKDVLWCQLWGKWLVWDGRSWKVDNRLQVNKMARDVARCFLNQAAEAEDNREMGKFIKLGQSAATYSRQTAMLNLVKTVVPTEPDELDANAMLLNTPTGTIDLTTGEVKAHDRKDKITKITKATFGDINVECPRWDEFLNEILSSNAELVDFMQRSVGYALTGEIRENVIFILHGDGANGKTTLIETVMYVLGDYAKSAAPDLLLQKRTDSHTTGVADLMGARFVSSVEVDDGRRLNEALVKRLTGRDTIKARFMRRDFFDFKPSHKLFLAVNHRPEIQGTDKGIWRRIRLIPFEVEIPEEQQDSKLLDKLIEEASGILSWAVKGCLKWQQSGLGLPSAVKEASQVYQAESDVIGRFIDECCEIDESYRITKRELYDFYKEWCEKNGERHHASKKFGGLIKKRRQFNEKRGRVDDKVVRFWVGLKLADDVFDDEGVLDFGNTIESSDSEGYDALSEQTLPSDHVRHEKITSRSVYKKPVATSGNIDEKTSEESSDSKGSSVLPKSEKAENESGNKGDETVPVSLRGKNMMKL
jgi:putative DNA primase/helicase